MSTGEAFGIQACSRNPSILAECFAPTGDGLERTMAEDADALSVSVRFYGLVRDVVGESSLEVRLRQGATVGELLDALADRYGERFCQRVMDGPGRLSRFVELIVNGRQVDRTVLDTPLATGDERQEAVVNVLVLPPAAGG